VHKIGEDLSVVPEILADRQTIRHVAIRYEYDTRCYFNVRSKVDMSQLNLPHGTNNITKKWKTEKVKSKKRISSEVIVNSPGNPCSQC